MATRFDITLSDADAEFLIGIVEKEYLHACRLAERQQDPVVAEWIRNQAKYISNLHEQLKSAKTKVEE